MKKRCANRDDELAKVALAEMVLSTDTITEPEKKHKRAVRDRIPLAVLCQGESGPDEPVSGDRSGLGSGLRIRMTSKLTSLFKVHFW